MSRRTWLVTGTFDVANYGDLLFPLLLARDAGPDVDVVAVSPVGGQPVADAAVSISFDEAARLPTVERVVFGGGNVLHAEPETNVYGRDAPTAYADLWRRALVLAHAHGAPLVWNAPGVPTSFAPVAAERLVDTARRSAHVSVRDEPSRARLLEAGVDVDVAVRPDPAWTVDTLWPRDELAQCFAARGADAEARHVALHVGPHRSHESPGEIARAMAALAEAVDARPVLLSIGACHGDAELLRRVGAELADDAGLDPLLVVDDEPVPLRDVAAVLASSVAYAGASMHGAITAMAFGRPALIVADGGGHKLGALCEAIGEPRRWVRRWQRAPDRHGLLADQHAAATAAVADRFRSALDAHRAAITDPSAQPVGGEAPLAPGEDLPWVSEILAASLDQLDRNRRLVQATRRWARDERRRLVDERDAQRRIALTLHADVADLRRRLGSRRG